MKILALVCAMILPHGIAMSAPSDVSQSPTAERAEIVGATEQRSPEIETLRGFITSVDQQSDSISVRVSPRATEQFRVQDGLLFDAVRFGDVVDVSVQSIDGVRTIIGLE
jgi:hypothetical protein